MRRCLLLLALALVPALALTMEKVRAAGEASRVTAQGARLAQGVAITGVVAGYGLSGGTFRYNGPSVLRPNDVWVPVRVALSNDGGNDVTGQLVLTEAGSGNGPAPAYRTEDTREVALPAGARKALTLYIRAADVGSQVTVALLVNGQTVDTRTISPAATQGVALSIGVLSDGPAARAALRGLTFGDTALSVAALGGGTPLDPQPEALNNFDLIVLANYSAAGLTASQVDALRAWVAGGGVLLVTGGPGAQKTMGSLAPDLLAARLRSTMEAPALPELAAIAGDRVSVQGPVELPVAAPRAGAAVLAAHAGVPLAVDFALGRGYLVYSALDPTQAPLSTWAANAQGDFWAHLLAPALRGPLDALIADDMQTTASVGGFNTPPSTLTGDLGAVPRRALPARQVYLLLIGLYILVLGPGNYALLRWRRRLEWSWVTVPVLSILFGLASFGLAYQRNGGDVLASTDTVVYLDAGEEPKLSDVYIGLHAPFRGNYDVSTSSSSLAWPLGGDGGGSLSVVGGPALGLRIDDGPPLTAHLLDVQMWSLRTLGLRQQLDLPGEVTSSLILRGKSVSGTVTNNTNLTLHDCAVVGANGASAVIPLLAPGQTVHVAPFGLGSATNVVGYAAGTASALLTNIYVAANVRSGGKPWQPLVPADRYATVLGSVVPNGSLTTVNAPLTLIGWSTAQLATYAVNGTAPHRSDLDLIIAPLTLSLGKGPFIVRPGDLPVGVLGTTVAPQAGTVGSLTLSEGDHVDVELALPAARGSLQIDSLSVQSSAASTTGGLTAKDAAFWNWRAQRWDTIDLSSGVFALRHAAAYVSPDGRVRLRIQATQGESLNIASVDQNLQMGVAGREE